MRTSLYRHFNAEGELLYVGISLSALNRLGQHAEHSHWFASINRVTIEHFETRQLALSAEREAIIKEKPKHNIAHRYGALAAGKQAESDRLERDKIAIEAAKAKKQLTANFVKFWPVYGPREAADALCVSRRVMNTWIRENKIGHIVVPGVGKNPNIYISGWQLIDKLEELHTQTQSLAAMSASSSR